MNRLTGEPYRVNTGQPSSRDLRAVLFDSGGVPTEPVGGRWNPRADFEQTVLRHASWVTDGQFAVVIAVGDQFFARLGLHARLWRVSPGDLAGARG